METFNIVVVIAAVSGALAIIYKSLKNQVSNEDLRKDAKLEQQQEDKKKEITDLKSKISKTEQEQRAKPNPEDFWRQR